MGQLIRRGNAARKSLWLLAPLTVALVACVPVAASAGTPGCKSIAKGKLDVELPANQRSSRMVRLSAGDNLSFLISGSGDTKVTLVSGSGAPRPIVTPESGRMASFSAPASEAYVFAIEAGPDSQASVAVNCTRADSASAAAEPEPITIEDSPSRASAFSIGFAEIAASKLSDEPLGRWIGKETASAFCDTASDDIYAGGIALSLGANAEIGPDDLPEVLERLTRSEDDAVGLSDVQVAMAQQAILADFKFEPIPLAMVANKAPKPAAQKPSDAYSPAAEAQHAAASAETWVAAVHDRRVDDSEVEATVSVSRPAALASADFPPPPMALGAALPFDEVQTSAADMPTQ